MVLFLLNKVFETINTKYISKTLVIIPKQTTMLMGSCFFSLTFASQKQKRLL